MGDAEPLASDAVTEPAAGAAAVDIADDDDSSRPGCLIEPPSEKSVSSARHEGADEPLTPSQPPAPPPTPAAGMASASVRNSIALGDDPDVGTIMAVTNYDELQEALKAVDAWQYNAEQTAGIERAKTYVMGSDKNVLCAFWVSSINEVNAEEGPPWSSALGPSASPCQLAGSSPSHRLLASSSSAARPCVAPALPVVSRRAPQRPAAHRRTPSHTVAHRTATHRTAPRRTAHHPPMDPPRARWWGHPHRPRSGRWCSHASSC